MPTKWVSSRGSSTYWNWGRATAAPFQIFTGTSVGAINTTYLAANAHLGSLGIDTLIEIWESLTIGMHLRVDPLSFIGRPRRTSGSWRKKSNSLGHAIIDPKPLEDLVAQSIDWQRLNKNVDDEAVRIAYYRRT